jgi:hypothetical protein
MPIYPDDQAHDEGRGERIVALGFSGDKAGHSCYSFSVLQLQKSVGPSYFDPVSTPQANCVGASE